jgi:hypothetical protein
VQNLTYRSKYGFEIRYPAGLTVNEKGPDTYELQHRAGEHSSGTQEPLLDQIILQDGTEGVVEIDVAHHPLLDASDDWLLRPCGQDGFMRIESKANVRVAGRRAVHVVSVGETEYDLGQRTHFVCVNEPRPLIFTYADEMRKRAEAILATLQFTQ